MSVDEAPLTATKPAGISRAMVVYTVARVVLQWVGVLAILLGLVAWLGLPQWARAVAFMFSISIMVGLLRVELTIRSRDLHVRIAQMEREWAAESTGPANEE